MKQLEVMGRKIYQQEHLETFKKEDTLSLSLAIQVAGVVQGVSEGI